MAIGGRRWGRAMGRGARGGRGATVLRKGNSATPSRPSLPGRHAISTPRAPLGPAATKCAGSADACVRACPLPPPSSLSVCLSHQGTYLCCGVASLPSPPASWLPVAACSCSLSLSLLTGGLWSVMKVLPHCLQKQLNCSGNPRDSVQLFPQKKSGPSAEA